MMVFNKFHHRICGDVLNRINFKDPEYNVPSSPTAHVLCRSHDRQAANKPLGEAICYVLRLKNNANTNPIKGHCK